jgi:hypothetical protein
LTLPRRSRGFIAEEVTTTARKGNSEALELPVFQNAARFDCGTPKDLIGFQQLFTGEEFVHYPRFADP